MFCVLLRTMTCCQWGYHFRQMLTISGQPSFRTWKYLAPISSEDDSKATTLLPFFLVVLNSLVDGFKHEPVGVMSISSMANSLAFRRSLATADYEVIVHVLVSSILMGTINRGFARLRQVLPATLNYGISEPPVP